MLHTKKSKCYPLQLQKRRILKLVFFVPMFHLVTTRIGAQENHMTKIDMIKVHKEMLNNKYHSSKPAISEKKFEVGLLCSYVPTSDHPTPGWSQFGPLGHDMNKHE